MFVWVANASVLTSAQRTSIERLKHRVFPKYEGLLNTMPQGAAPDMTRFREALTEGLKADLKKNPHDAHDLYVIAACECPSALPILKAAKIPIHSQSKKIRNTPLHTAVQMNHPGAVEKLLRHGAPVDALNSNRIPPILLAVQESQEAILQHLLTHGAKTDWRPILGTSADLVTIAASKNQEGIKRALIAHGAPDIAESLTIDHLINKPGLPENVKEKLRHLKHVDEDEMEFTSTVLEAQNEVLLSLLLLKRDLMKKSLINDLLKLYPLGETDELGQTMLHHVVLQDSQSMPQKTKLAMFLINHGVGLDMVDDTGRTALHHATATFRIPGEDTKDLDELIKLMVKRGADINKADRAGNTPLHLLVEAGGNEAMVDFLIKHGANPKTRNQSNQMPLQLAVMNGNESAQKALFRYLGD